MLTVNDVLIFEHGEPFTFPVELPPVPEYRTAFGFKIREKDGLKEWIPMEESDFRRLHEQVGLSEADADALVEKAVAGLGCFISNGSCGGSGCPPGSGCRGFYSGNGHLLSCNCGA